MSKPTLAQQVEALTALVTTLVAAQTPDRAASPVATVQHIGPSGKPDGRRFPCTAAPSCGRILRSVERAAIHGVEAGGHVAA